jgi:hypothetical protein
MLSSQRRENVQAAPHFPCFGKIIKEGGAILPLVLDIVYSRSAYRDRFLIQKPAIPVNINARLASDEGSGTRPMGYWRR